MLKDFLELIRLPNCLMASLAAYIGFALKLKILDLNLIYALLSVFLICAAGMIINDIVDIKIDRERPLSKRKISIKISKLISVLFFSLGIFFSFLINFIAFLIAIFASLSLILYSFKMQKLKFLGNFIVALNSSLPFLFGYFAASINFENFLIILSFFLAALFASLARELLKDLEQKEIDKGFKVTLPHLLGEKNCIYFVFVYSFLAILFLSLPLFTFKLKFLNTPYILFLFLASLILIFSFKLSVSKYYAKAKLFAKIAMLFALIAFLFFII